MAVSYQAVSPLFLQAFLRRRVVQFGTAGERPTGALKAASFLPLLAFLGFRVRSIAATGL